MKKTRFLLLSLTIISLATKSLTAGDYKTLIDFSKYETINQQNNTYEKDNEEFRQRVYQRSNEIKANETIAYAGSFIPWFRVTPKDISLDRWVIKYIYPSGQRSPSSILTKKLVTPLAQSKKLNETSLGAYIYFPNREDQLSVTIQPPYDVYSYDRDGQLTNLGNGILNNVSQIEKISTSIGFKGPNIKNIAIFVNIRNSLGEIQSYPMGFLHSQLQGVIRYFKDYNGKYFQRSNEITREASQKLPVYYKVYYKNNQAVLWTMIKDHLPVYHEMTLEWANSDYLPPTPREGKRIPLYPGEIPHIKFHSFTVTRQDETSIRQFYLFIRNVRVKYLRLLPDGDLSIDDDVHWNIHKEIHLKRRHHREGINANRIYQMIKYGWSSGFRQYKDFVEHIFLRLPPVQD